MLKKLASVPILALFLCVSMYSAIASHAKPHGLPSSALVKNEEKEPGFARTFYTDEKGNLAYASNLRYAAYLRFYNEENKLIREEFYDEFGKPAEQSLGHIAATRSYNQDGKLEYIAYLGKDDHAIKTIYDYSYLYRVYSENLETDWYLGTDMSPVKHISGYYAYRKTYDDKNRVVALEYLDKNSKLINNVNGIALQVRTFNEKGKIATEFYFDKDGKPAKGIYGQYGVSHDYNENGQIILTTYLDQEGNPIVTSRGFSKIRKAYYKDGTYADYYYDAQDQPVALSRGQYGSRTINGQIIYLDKHGNEQFDLHNYLNYNHQSVMILGILILAASTLLGKFPNIVIFLAYALFIAYMTLLYREAGDNRLNLTLFWSYRQFFESPSLRTEVMNNIWLFVPAGFILGRICKTPYPVLACFVMSIAIEITQYAFGIGLCELDDIFGNTLGGLVGCLACSCIANPIRSLLLSQKEKQSKSISQHN